MRKRYLAAAAAAAIMMMAAGCSNKTQESTTQAVETEAKTEAKTEESSAPAAPAAPEGGVSGELMGEEAPQGPIRVWGTILEVGDGSILATCESDTSNMGEVLLMIDPDSTYVLDAVNGLPVELGSVEIGNFEAYLSEAMTMSLPPQNTPYAVIVNIPENMQAPQYVVASDAVDTSGGVSTLTGIDETQYTLARSVDVQPFLTKNIVTLDDVQEGTRCLVWMNDESDVDKIVVFGD
ncbi:MAG: hypothetical protein HFG73_04865 [Hungatella sp.]|nr:hypothetical protein [Hungatella sp.]